ncbi:sugar transporter domain-containing protein [Ditylenchus destructor]|nr:sugar transporter domain-containing protein [Ditylenchus destructor]
MMLTPLYYASVLTVTLGGSTQFYSYGIVNPEQELITAWINETYAKRNGVGLSETGLNFFWSFVVSSIAIGAIFGALLTRTLAERLGRRDALIANGIVNVLGALLEYFAKYAESPEFIILGRIILGANMGLTSGLVPMYLMEISPNSFRGTAGTFHMVAVAFSDWFSLLLGLPEVLGSAELWPLAFGFPGLPALALCFVLPFCPESPKFTLITKGRREQALSDLQKLVGPQEAKNMFESLIREAALSQDGAGTYKEIFTRKDMRIPLLVSILVMVAQQFTGCAAVFAYSTDMFLNAQLTPKMARYSTLGVGVAYFIFACSAPFLIERLGRRFLIIFQLTFCTLALTLLSFFTFVQHTLQGIWGSYATIGALIFYMCCYGVGSPVPWMITSEIFPTKFRSAAVTVAVFVAWFLSFFISTGYLPFQQAVGTSLSYLPFILVSSVTAVALYILLPETRGKQSGEIVEEIRFRAQSVSIGRPLRDIPEEFDEETRMLVRDGVSSDEHSYHRYMSINGTTPIKNGVNGTDRSYHPRLSLHRIL